MNERVRCFIRQTGNGSFLHLLNENYSKPNKKLSRIASASRLSRPIHTMFGRWVASIGAWWKHDSFYGGANRRRESDSRLDIRRYGRVAFGNCWWERQRIVLILEASQTVIEPATRWIKESSSAGRESVIEINYHSFIKIKSFAGLVYVLSKRKIT